jgi:hypothetical protein
VSGVAWAAVRAQLATMLPGVVGSGVTVYNGPVVSNEAPLAYLTLGNVPSTDNEGAGTFSQDVGPDGFSALEGGTVLAELGAVAGTKKVPDVFTTFAAIAAWVQADMTLGGVLTPGSTCTVSADVVEAQTTAGAVQRLLLTFTYTTRLP